MQLNSSQTIAGNTIWHTGNLNLADDGQNLYYKKTYKIFQTSAKPDVDKGEVLNAATVNRPTINRELNVAGDEYFTPKINLSLGANTSKMELSKAGELSLQTSTGQNIIFPKVSGTVVTTGNYPQWADIGGEYFLVKNGETEIRPNNKDLVTAQSAHNILPFSDNSQSIGLQNRKFSNGFFTQLSIDNQYINKLYARVDGGAGLSFTNSNGFVNTNISAGSKNKPADLVLGYDDSRDQRTRNVVLNKPLVTPTGKTIIDADGKLDFNDLKNNNKVDKSGDQMTGNLTFDGLNQSSVIFKTDNQRVGSIKSQTTLAGKQNSNEILFKNEGIDLKVNGNNILTLDKDKISAQNASINALEAQTLTVNGNLLVKKEIPQNDNQEQAANTKWVRQVAISEIENLKNTIQNNGVITTTVTASNQYKLGSDGKLTTISYSDKNLKIDNNQVGNLYYKDRLVYDSETIPIQSTKLAGIVKLDNQVTSQDQSIAATSLAAKTAFDKGVEALDLAKTKVAKAGDTMTGDLTLPNAVVQNNVKLVNIGTDKSKVASFGLNDENIFLYNPHDNKFFAIKNNGRITYGGKLLFSEDQLPSWNHITNKPTTVEGYNIQNAVVKGGKSGMDDRQVFIGASSNNRLLAQINNENLGYIAFQQHLDQVNNTLTQKTNTLENNKFDKSGGTITGYLNITQGDWSSIALFNSSGRYTRIETTPHLNADMLQFVYREANGSNINVATLRRRTGEIAFKDEIDWYVLTRKPQTIDGYGITDAVTINTSQTVTGTKTFNDIRVNSRGGSWAGAYNDGNAAYWANEYNASNKHEFVPFLGGRVRNARGGWIAALSFGYESSNNDGWGNGIVQIREDNGHEVRWMFRHNGEFYAPGKMYAGGNMEANHFHSRNGAYFVGNLDVNDVNIRSDKRLKRNLNRIDNALEKVQKLSGYTYEVNQIGTDIWESSAGLIAQDLKEVLPSAVRIDKNTNYMTVSYNQVIGLLIEAIKELQEKTKKKSLIQKIKDFFK